MCVWSNLVGQEGWVRNWQLEFEMVFGHLKPKGMQGNFWQRLSSNPTTCFKQEAQILNPKTWSFCMGSGWGGNFELIMLIFELSFSLPLMSLKLILNSPKFWTQPFVIEFEPQDTLKQVSKASIQFKTLCTQLELVIFEPLLGYLWFFSCNK